jgi:protein tyrosine phosphatase
LSTDRIQDLKRFSNIEKKNECCDIRFVQKNRYGNVFPGEESRVILDTYPENDESSQYINANFLKVNDIEMYFSHCTCIRRLR